jgi:periplasmic divalent cation tolerance protein
MNAAVAYITCKDRDEALRIGKALLENRLAACVNALDRMTSMYWWEGRIESADECVLLAKTTSEKQADLVRKVKELHSYSVPCVVFWPLSGGNPDYLDWIRKETGNA